MKGLYYVMIFIFCSCGSLKKKSTLNHVKLITYKSYSFNKKDSIKYSINHPDTFDIFYRRIFKNNQYLYTADYVRCNEKKCIWNDPRHNFELVYNYRNKIIKLDSVYFMNRQEYRYNIYLNSVSLCQVKSQEL